MTLRYAVWGFFISIHALREEGDASRFTSLSSKLNFYPRPPRGGRLALLAVVELDHEISIHALREEGDPDVGERAVEQSISIHALREEGDPVSQRLHHHLPISIHALREEGDSARSSRFSK